jgi:perosamine synthetase
MRIGRTLPPAASPIYVLDIINGIKGLIRGQKEIERFRSELKDQYGVKHCFLVSSGKAALTLILKALHNLHPERDEVLIPAFICYSVPSAIVRAGLKVKLCDVNPDTLDFDYDQLGKLVAQSSKRNKLKADEAESSKGHIQTKDSELSAISYELSANRLLAIISAHLFGLPANIDKVRDKVSDPAVTIIEDAAQVLRSTWGIKNWELWVATHFMTPNLKSGK